MYIQALIGLIPLHPSLYYSTPAAVIRCHFKYQMSRHTFRTVVAIENSEPNMEKKNLKLLANIILSTVEQIKLDKLSLIND